MEEKRYDPPPLSLSLSLCHPPTTSASIIPTLSSRSSLSFPPPTPLSPLSLSLSVSSIPSPHTNNSSTSSGHRLHKSPQKSLRCLVPQLSDCSFQLLPGLWLRYQTLQLKLHVGPHLLYGVQVRRSSWPVQHLNPTGL